MADPVSKADIDPVFEKRLRDIQQAAAAEHDQRSVGGQVLWDRPTGWAGVLTDFQAMHTAFARDKANADYLEATKDPKHPGTTGDIAATTTMIDYLATLERAFKVRHTLRRPRAMAHTLARKYGHGHQHGPLIQSVLEHVRRTLRQAKTQ